MKRLQKLMLNITIIMGLTIGLGYLYQYRLTPVSAAKLSGAHFFFDNPVATILGYKDVYAIVLLQQDQNVACYPAEKTLGILWKPVGYYKSPTTLNDEQDIESFKTQCLNELQGLFGPSQWLVYPLQSSAFHPNSPNGLDFEISEVDDDSFFRRYLDLMNTKFNDETMPYTEFKKTANIRTILYTSSNEGFSDLSSHPGAIDVELERPDVNGEPYIVHWYIQTDVNANLDYTVADVYYETQLLKTVIGDAMSQYTSVEAIEVLNAQELDMILEKVIAENGLKIFVIAQTLDIHLITISSRKEDYTDIRVFAEKEGWDFFETDLTYTQMTWMTYEDIYEAVGANKNNGILIKTIDDKYVRILSDDNISLSLTWLINEVTVDIAMNLRYSKDMRKVLSSKDYGSVIYDSALEQIKEAKTFEDLEANAINLRRALSERFDVHPLTFVVSVYADIKAN